MVRGCAPLRADNGMIGPTSCAEPTLERAQAECASEDVHASKCKRESAIGSLRRVAFWIRVSASGPPVKASPTKRSLSSMTCAGNFMCATPAAQESALATGSVTASTKSGLASARLRNLRVARISGGGLSNAH